MPSLRLLSGHWGPQRASRELHLHCNHGLEVVVIRAGRLRWQVDGVAEDVGPGQVFFTLPWQRHGGVDPRQPNCDLSFVVLPLAPEATPTGPLTLHPDLGLALAAEDQAVLLATLAGCSRHAHPATGDLLNLVPRLVDALAGERRTRVGALATLVLLDLAESVARGAPEADAGAGQRVRDFLADLPATCHHPWTLAGMARRCGLGRTRFSELVERETGDSPGTLLLRLRATRLADLLTTSRRSVLDLALDCGFSSGQHAARVFRTYFAMSPRDWRIRART